MLFLMKKINREHINTSAKSKYTIVFLHEGLGCIKTWQGYPKRLCKLIGTKGLIYDRPGYGKSEGDLSNRKKDYLVEAADDLNELILELKLDHIILYGHSDGASIALAYAALYPKKIKVIISEAAHVIVEKITIEGIVKTVTAFQKGKLKGLSNWHGANYTSVFNAWAKTWLSSDFDLEAVRLLLPKINVPTLIIQGNKDQYGSLRQVDIIKKEISGNVTSYITDCGHTPYAEQTSEVLNYISTYLKKTI